MWAICPTQPRPQVTTGAGWPSIRSLHARPAQLANDRPAWEGRYTRSAIVSDTTAVTVVSSTAVLLLSLRVADLGNDLLSAVLGPAVAVLLLVAISLAGASDPRGARRPICEVPQAGAGICGTSIGLGLVGLAAGHNDVRSRVFVVLPVACLLAVLRRFVLRIVLHRRRAVGECSRHVLAVATRTRALA